VTRAEFHEASLNLVRKLSGYRHPSAANKAAFERAVEELTEQSMKLLANLKIKGGVTACVET
jgi:hypothetical protein